MFCSRVEFSGTAEWRYFRFEQIQDGGRHLGKISNDHIFATGRPIHFMFGYMDWVFGDGGSNGAIFDSNKFKISWIILNGHSLYPQRLTIYLYSAHRAVIFVIAQLSCYKKHGRKLPSPTLPIIINARVTPYTLPILTLALSVYVIFA